MKANTLRRLLSLALGTALALTLALPAAAADSEPANEPTADDSTVTIYTTNDIHGMVQNTETNIGLAQIAGIRASTPTLCWWMRAMPRRARPSPPSRRAPMSSA